MKKLIIAFLLLPFFCIAQQHTFRTSLYAKGETYTIFWENRVSDIKEAVTDSSGKVVAKIDTNNIMTIYDSLVTIRSMFNVFRSEAKRNHKFSNVSAGTYTEHPLEGILPHKAKFKTENYDMFYPSGRFRSYYNYMQ